MITLENDRTHGPRTAPAAGRRGLRLSVRDVTRTHRTELESVDPLLRVSTVAETVATDMGLSATSTPWALRSERTARYLDDVSIGEALRAEPTDPAAEVSLVLTPKAHLG